MATGLPSASSETAVEEGSPPVGDALHDDVSVGGHALESVVFAADRKCAHTEVAHLAGGVTPPHGLDGRPGPGETPTMCVAGRHAALGWKTTLTAPFFFAWNIS